MAGVSPHQEFLGLLVRYFIASGMQTELTGHTLRTLLAFYCHHDAIEKMDPFSPALYRFYQKFMERILIESKPSHRFCTPNQRKILQAIPNCGKKNTLATFMKISEELNAMKLIPQSSLYRDLHVLTQGEIL
jgi:hypothetical protein